MLYKWDRLFSQLSIDLLLIHCALDMWNAFLGKQCFNCILSLRFRAAQQRKHRLNTELTEAGQILMHQLCGVFFFLSLLTFFETENAILAFGNDTDSKSAANQPEAASPKTNIPNQHLDTSTITTTTISIESQQNIFHPQIPTQVSKSFCEILCSPVSVCICVWMCGWGLFRSVLAVQLSLLMQDTWPEGKTVGMMINEWRYTKKVKKETRGDKADRPDRVSVQTKITWADILFCIMKLNSLLSLCFPVPFFLLSPTDERKRQTTEWLYPSITWSVRQQPRKHWPGSDSFSPPHPVAHSSFLKQSWPITAQQHGVGLGQHLRLYIKTPLVRK